MVRLHQRTLAVQKAAAELHLAVVTMAEERDLTDVELLQALVAMMGSRLKYMLRAERHPEDPDTPAEWE